MVSASILALAAAAVFPVCGRLVANESSESLLLANDRLVTSVTKATGSINHLTLDGQDLLGSTDGRAGRGPYLDCYCVPSGFYTPGSKNATYKLITGTDRSGVPYGGIVMGEVYKPTGQLLEQYWFLRDGETGLHTFSRLAYYNETTPFLRNLQEFRTLFRPNTPLWTKFVTDALFHGPAPRPNPAAGGSGMATTVQDATWYLGDRAGDPYVEQMADYFTKYTFSAVWRDQLAHGLFADGTQGSDTDNSTFGAWLVMNTKDTYFGGPIHSDLVVDGILYNYMVSNHHGDGTPNITHGFDRTFGPQYFHFNKGPAGASIRGLLDDALQYATPEWNAEFYDDIAHHVPNYVPSSGRGSWKARIQLPQTAERPLAVLTQNGVDFQDNVEDTTAYQYWADIDPSNGIVSIDHVKAGTYRLTVYADGIFGDYVQDDIVVTAGNITDSGDVEWVPESAGRELWRIGIPDKSAGEYRHGDTPDRTHPLHPAEYRIYFGAYDFLDDFPEGVRFHVGQSDEARDWNYIHWSVFGGYANFRRPAQEVVGTDGSSINNWTIVFDIEDSEVLRGTSEATLTVQLAGAKTAAGNTDVFNATERYNDLPFAVSVNGHELEAWIIPYYHSSSCGVRSAVICYQVAHKFTFPTEYLTSGAGNRTNDIVLSLPFNATDYESALLPRSVYVQYDALRLEVK
ncbi:Rhamnogalacturonate lyase B [Apiospora rasikravindrae]|uniref:rhamnogalacturonan endolyase n=1 Tax=Apiospora rasikravindrae TaxID=990691 RepID=A0ABR1TW19_9PEZI